MKYITITFDLSEEDYEGENAENLERFLEEAGFVFDSDIGEVPSTTLIKPAEAEDDIEAIMENVVVFCRDNEIGLTNLIVTGAAAISHYLVPHVHED